MIAGVLEIQLMANMSRLSDDMRRTERVVGDSMTKVERSVASASRALSSLGLGVSIGLIADQAPTTSPEKHWTEFLGQDTAFYMGPELLGRALRSQVLLGRMRRLERGRYEFRFEALNVVGERLPHGEITNRYARGLEAWIREDPAGWWWSHKRWKLRREPG